MWKDLSLWTNKELNFTFYRCNFLLNGVVDVVTFFLPTFLLLVKSQTLKFYLEEFYFEELNEL